MSNLGTLAHCDGRENPVLIGNHLRIKCLMFLKFTLQLTTITFSVSELAWLCEY